MNANIFQLTQEARELLSAFDWLTDPENGQTGSDEQLMEIFAVHTQNQEEMKAKILAYRDLVKSVEADLAAIKAETDRLGKLRKTKKNFVERLKTAVHEALTAAEITEVKDATRRVFLKKNPLSVEITSEDDVPEFLMDDTDKTFHFKEKELKVNIDKTAIKEWFKKTGEVLPGTVIHENKFSVEMK